MFIKHRGMFKKRGSSRTKIMNQIDTSKFKENL